MQTGELLVSSGSMSCRVRYLATSGLKICWVLSSSSSIWLFCEELYASMKAIPEVVPFIRAVQGIQAVYEVSRPYLSCGYNCSGLISTLQYPITFQSILAASILVGITLANAALSDGESNTLPPSTPKLDCRPLLSGFGVSGSEQNIDNK